MNKQTNILFINTWKRKIIVNKFNFSISGVNRKYIINGAIYKAKRNGNIFVLRRISSINNHQEPTLFIEVIEKDNSELLDITFKASNFIKIFSVFTYIISILLIIYGVVTTKIILIISGFVFVLFDIIITLFINYNNTLEILSDLKTLCK